jgi:hypothetical protein
LEDLDAAAAATAESLKDQLRKLQQLLLQIHSAQDSLQQQLDKEPGKYQIRKMGAGSIEHFHNGLTDRIGKRRWAVFVFEHVNPKPLPFFGFHAGHRRAESGL